MDIEPGDYVVSSLGRTDLVVDCPPGTPFWLQEECVWIRDYCGLSVPTGKSRKYFRRVCRHCKKLPENHINGQCLFSSTSYE